METPSIAATSPAAARACPSCNGPVDVRSRHVIVAGSAVRIYCSEQCLEASTAPVNLLAAPELPEPPRRWPHVLGIISGLGLFVVLRGPEVDSADGRTSATPILPVAPAAPATSPDVAAREAAALAEQKLEAAWVADLRQDAWFHPLAGPRRHMPRNHTQAFGAERPGERPAQCLSGHCGVDVGGGLWGEPVHAAHEGVVDRVNRGPNEEHGGVYVRIAHRDGTVFTWYFHLAAVPRWIIPGTKVEAGQIIGLVGDTGVKLSAPHLHFAITVRPTKDAPERYLDPESLLAIWPLWIPDENGSGLGRVSTREPPGVPMRGARGKAKKNQARAESRPETAEPADPAPATAGTAATPAAPADPLPAAPATP
jgi:murein DD-endopeptidase MepM/ murein hydrolase activator NlpD